MILCTCDVAGGGACLIHQETEASRGAVARSMHENLLTKRPPRVYRICEPYELEKLTQKGWRYVKEIVYHTAEKHDEITPFVLPAPSGGYASISRETVSRTLIVPHLVFLLAMDEEGALKATTEMMECIRKELSRALDEKIHAEGTAKKIAATVTQMTRDFEETSKILKYAQERNAMLLEANTKLEGHIAKLRNAIGELRMNEILVGGK